jgi:cytochrome c oxidase subunit II
MDNTPIRVRQLRTAVILWVIFTVALEAVFLLLAPHLIDWTVLPAGASDRSGSVNSVLAIFTVLSIPVFTFVVVFAIYAVIKNGSRIGPRAEGPAVVVNPRLQSIWLIVSIVLVIFLYFYGLAFLNEVSAAPTGNVLHITVTGEQWLWDYTYTDPQYGGIQSTQLYLPVNVPVEFTIQSVDVQHSFWIPAFAIKQDAVPGETTHISATPKQPGDYVVRCAELCGLYHAYMETPVHVVSMADFTSWAAQQPTPAPAPSSFSPPDIALTGTMARYSSVAEG